MKPMRLLQTCVALGALALLGGCATNRGSMALAVPGSAPASSVAAADRGGKLAVIDEVRDQRVFEADPRNPSTPSLKKGEAYALDADARKQAIARKRNTWGKALGDIVLEGNDTVETVTADLVRTGLQARGYRVVDAAQAGADALHVRVVIDKFWAWFTPGFWSVAMEAQVHTTLTLDGAGAGAAKTANVQAYGLNRGQSGREANWQLAYQRTFEDYAGKFQTALDVAGL